MLQIRGELVKRELLEQGFDPSGFVYRYTTATEASQRGPFTQAWIARGRYLVRVSHCLARHGTTSNTHPHTTQVLDVTAGPCQHGVVGAGEGTVAPGSLPRVGSDISADPPPPDAAGERSLYKGVCSTSLTRQLLC